MRSCTSCEKSLSPSTSVLVGAPKSLPITFVLTRKFLPPPLGAVRSLAITSRWTRRSSSKSRDASGYSSERRSSRSTLASRKSSIFRKFDWLCPSAGSQDGFNLGGEERGRTGPTGTARRCTVPVSPETGRPGSTRPPSISPSAPACSGGGGTRPAAPLVLSGGPRGSPRPDPRTRRRRSQAARLCCPPLRLPSPPHCDRPVLP